MTSGLPTWVILSSSGLSFRRDWSLVEGSWCAMDDGLLERVFAVAGSEDTNIVSEKAMEFDRDVELTGVGAPEMLSTGEGSSAFSYCKGVGDMLLFVSPKLRWYCWAASSS